MVDPLLESLENLSWRGEWQVYDKNLQEVLNSLEAYDKRIIEQKIEFVFIE